MVEGKTLIQVVLFDGDPEGVRTANVVSSTFLGLAFKMSQLGRVAKEFKDTMNRPGVYIRYGVSGSGKPTAYIGEAENIHSRLKWHSTQDKDKDKNERLSDVIVLTDSNDNISKSHARFAEAELLKAARQNLGWDFENAQNPPSAGKLPKHNEVFMKPFVEQAKILAGALGCGVFKSSSIQQQLAEQPSGADGQAPAFKMSGKGYEARATLLHRTGEMVVRVGSMARLAQAGACPKSAAAARADMIHSGILKPTATGLLFTQDQPFPSASAAACVVTGGSVNGLNAWKLNDDSGLSYGDWMKSQES